MEHRMRYWRFFCVVITVHAAFCHANSAFAQKRRTEFVVLVTLDGLRWQELFGGADERLINKDNGVSDAEDVKQRFWRGTAEERRTLLMPFFWEHIVSQGQVFGDPSRNSTVQVTNGRFFSYPGYNEILSGFGDPTIDSNDKVNNKNVTVLEWLNRMPGYKGHIAAYGSWDVFPFIINTERSGIYVNAGWQELDTLPEGERKLLNLTAEELPHYWSGVRYDVFTIRGALGHLHERNPRVLYVALGETDDWAHAGRYDLYLDSAWRNDRYIRWLWESVQEMPAYAGKTSFVVTTDHGRGDGRDGWKSHGAGYPGSDRIWIAVWGPDTPADGIREGVDVTQGQIAATVAKLLGEDFTEHDSRIAEPLPVLAKE